MSSQLGLLGNRCRGSSLHALRHQAGLAAIGEEKGPVCRTLSVCFGDIVCSVPVGKAEAVLLTGDMTGAVHAVFERGGFPALGSSVSLSSSCLLATRCVTCGSCCNKTWVKAPSRAEGCSDPHWGAAQHLAGHRMTAELGTSGVWTNTRQR